MSRKWPVPAKGAGLIHQQQQQQQQLIVTICDHRNCPSAPFDRTSAPKRGPFCSCSVESFAQKKNQSNLG